MKECDDFRSRFNFIPFLIGALIFSLCLGGHGLQVVNAQEQDEIDKLIEQLGDDDIEVREAAQSALIDRIRNEKDPEKRASIIEKVKKATTSNDPEVRGRATEIIKAIERRIGVVSFESESSTDGDVFLTVELEGKPEVDDNLCSVHTNFGGLMKPEDKLKELEKAIKESTDPDCKALQTAIVSNTRMLLEGPANGPRIDAIELEDNSVQETDLNVIAVLENVVWRARCLLFPLTRAAVKATSSSSSRYVSLRLNGVSAKAQTTDALGNLRDVKDITSDLFREIQFGDQFKNLRDQGLRTSLEGALITVTAPFSVLLAFNPDEEGVNAILSAEFIEINDNVTFEPVQSTFETVSSTAGCPSGFVGKFSFDARLTNVTDSILSDLQVMVARLTNGNLLQNADKAPDGAGGILMVPEKGGFSDRVLSLGEFVDVPFVICLKEKKPFSFLVDVLGTVK